MNFNVTLQQIAAEALLMW